MDEAYAGDIIGIHNPASCRLGDVLTEGEHFTFKVSPTSGAGAVQPRAPLRDQWKANSCRRACAQLGEEGAVCRYSSRWSIPTR